MAVCVGPIMRLLISVMRVHSCVFACLFLSAWHHFAPTNTGVDLGQGG